MKHLIAFTGLKGSGKDTAASVFVEAGYEHIKMAGALKAMLRALLAYQGLGPEVIDEWIEGSLKERPCMALNGASMRQAMVTLGTEWGRESIDSDLWVDVVRRRCHLNDRVVISDVRFPNEVDLVHELGGAVIRLNRGVATPDAHPSESNIPSLHADLDVFNDFGSATCLRAYIKARFLN